MAVVNITNWQVETDDAVGVSPRHSALLADPPVGGYNILPAMISDTVDLVTPIRGFETTVAGNVCVIGADDVTVILYGRQANSRTSFLIKRILRTGTTEALYTAVDGRADASSPLIGLR